MKTFHFNVFSALLNYTTYFLLASQDRFILWFFFSFGNLHLFYYFGFVLFFFFVVFNYFIDLYFSLEIVFYRETFFNC